MAGVKGRSGTHNNHANAGRKKGVPNVVTQRIAAHFAKDGDVTPLEIMIRTMRHLWNQAGRTKNSDKKLEKMLQACTQAEKAAPYMHARLVAQQVHVTHDDSKRTLEDINAELAHLDLIASSGADAGEGATHLPQQPDGVVH